MDLRFEQLSCHYRGTPEAALDKVSGGLAEGRITGIFGANGSGKSTLLHCLAGLLTPSAGTVRLNGRLLEEYSHLELARHMALAAQEIPATCAFTVRELVELGRYPFGDRHPGRVEEALQKCGLTALAERHFDHLSGGEKRRTLLARALTQCGGILLLDEPATHLDPARQLDLYELLRELTQHGITVAMTCHDLLLAPTFTDRALLLHRGRIVAAGTPEEVLTAENTTAAFGRPIRVTQW